MLNVNDHALCDRWYQALLERDSEYTGVFFVGVKTTGIFCIADCRARKPKRENVEFYRDAKSALAAGFRPCKICRPIAHAQEAPAFIEQALALVKSSPKTRIKDSELRRQHISPERVRRWFLKHHGITFQAYQRMYRINTAVQELKEGHSMTDAAFDSGYESLSGFAYTYNKHLKAGAEHVDTIIHLHRFTTLLGPMFAGATETGICLLEFTDRRMLETEFRDLQRRLKATILYGENHHTRQAEKELTEYFAGQRQTFSLSLELHGSDFQREVWEALDNIPYGNTVSYQALAQQLQRPNGARAVANAVGANRVAIVIPCHRVIGKNGQLTGYAGGLPRKRWLLEHELHSHSKSN